MLFSSCTKEEVADDTQTGNIKVSITYIPPSSSSYVYFLSEAFAIRLKKTDPLLLLKLIREARMT